jgi:hypothetical protein
VAPAHHEIGNLLQHPGLFLPVIRGEQALRVMWLVKAPRLYTTRCKKPLEKKVALGKNSNKM